MGFMVLDPNNDRGHQIDGVSEKGQEYQAVRIFGKDNLVRVPSGRPVRAPGRENGEVETGSCLFVVSNINRHLMSTTDPQLPFPINLGTAGAYCKQTYRRWKRIGSHRPIVLKNSVPI